MRFYLADYVQVGAVKSGTHAYEDGGLETGKVYLYTVRAVGPNGRESRDSPKARTQPPVVKHVCASAAGAKEVALKWDDGDWLVHPDVMRYRVYRRLVHVATNTTSRGSWGYNDPEYADPVVDRVVDIADVRKIAETPTRPYEGRVNYNSGPDGAPVDSPHFVDKTVDLTRKGPESADYKYAVYAYIVRAVNGLGTESGPSPYALTIPAEPENVMLRQKNGEAEIRWQGLRSLSDAQPDKPLTEGEAWARPLPYTEPLWRGDGMGYRIYRVDAKNVTRLTAEPIRPAWNLFPIYNPGHARYVVVGVDVLGQEGQPSSPVWSGQSYQGFFHGPWHH